MIKPSTIIFLSFGLNALIYVMAPFFLRSGSEKLAAYALEVAFVMTVLNGLITVGALISAIGVKFL